MLVGRRFGVAARAKLAAARSGKVLAVLRMVVVGKQLHDHGGDIRPAIGIEIGAGRLAERTMPTVSGGRATYDSV